MATKDRDIPGTIGHVDAIGDGAVVSGLEYPPDAKPLPEPCPRCKQPLAVGGLCPDRRCRGGATS